MLTDVIDILLVSVLVYSAIAWMRAARAHLALLGLAILGCVYLVARLLGLGLTAWLFQGFFAAFLVLVVVMFHSELRQALERLGLWGTGRAAALRNTPGSLEKLVSVVAQLSAQRRGALVVLPGRDPLDRHLQGGIALEGQLSEPLLLSLFDPHSPGHDGAVVLQGDRVRSFAVHLPLSSDQEQLKMRGTRHASALGIAEATDALCAVVSEETGRVSAAVDGALVTLESPTALSGVVRRFVDDRFGPPEQQVALWRRLRGDWKMAAAAAVASAALWLLVIPGSDVSETTFEVPIEVTNLPAGYVLERVEPPEVEVSLSGLRRDFFWIDRADLKLEIDALLVQLGRRTFRTSPEMVQQPPGLEVGSVEPDRVRLYVRAVPDGQDPEPIEPE